eukprot:1251032-Karenia_brevis.AAC.1
MASHAPHPCVPEGIASPPPFPTCLCPVLLACRRASHPPNLCVPEGIAIFSFFSLPMPCLPCVPNGIAFKDPSCRTAVEIPFVL